MDLNKKENRQEVGKVLNNVFNRLMIDAIKNSGEDNFSYMDMVNLSNTMKFEVQNVAGLKYLPHQVKVALDLAVAVMDPNKNRKDENLKNILSLGTVSTGATVATASVLTKAGAIATAKAAVCGGLAIGALPVAGVIGGLSLIAAAVYMHKSEMTPNERIAKCIEAVNAGIDDWIENGCDEN